MSQDFLKRVTIFAVALLGTGVIACGFAKGGLWAASVAVGLSWAFVNFVVLHVLLQMSLMPQADAAKRILALTLVKFPVIYLTGFFILKTRFFSMSGILTGLTLLFAAIALARLTRPRRAEQVAS